MQGILLLVSFVLHEFLSDVLSKYIFLLIRVTVPLKIKFISNFQVWSSQTCYAVAVQSWRPKHAEDGCSYNFHSCCKGMDLKLWAKLTFLKSQKIIDMVLFVWQLSTEQTAQLGAELFIVRVSQTLSWWSEIASSPAGCANSIPEGTE